MFIKPHLCKCGESDPGNFYPPRKGKCKSCCYVSSRNWQRDNPESAKLSKVKWALANKAKIAKKNKLWRQANITVQLAKERVHWSTDEERERKRLYSKNNRETINKYRKDRRDSDLSYLLECRHRKMVGLVFRGKTKTKSSFDLLGCDQDTFLAHISSLFLPGMSMMNRSEWHLDHIRPICSFDLSDPVQLMEAFNYQNVRPLWAKQNLSKAHQDKQLSFRRAA